MVTESTISLPDGPRRKILFWEMAYTLLTNPPTSSESCGSRKSFVWTVMRFLIRLPPLPLVSTLISMVPSPPGGICLV